MNEACDIDDLYGDGEILRCRTCGAMWDTTNDEESPCAARKGTLSTVLAALRPRTFFGLTVWVTAAILALAATMWGLDRLARAAVAYIGGAS